MLFRSALLRLLLLVILIGGVGAGIYYGAPYLREKFIAPVEQNTVRVNELENEISGLQTQLTEINNQLTETNNQLADTNTRIVGSSNQWKRIRLRLKNSRLCKPR